MRLPMRKWGASVLAGSGAVHPSVGNSRSQRLRPCWSVLVPAFVWRMSSCAGCIGTGTPYRLCPITVS